MAHTRQPLRAFPQVPHIPIAAVGAGIAAIVVATIISWSAFGSRNLDPPSAQAPNPAVLEAGRRWELQRKAEMGYVDPVVQAGRDWERQRRQQSAFD